MASYKIGPVDQIPVGEGRNFQVGEATIAVFRTHAGRVFATQATCPHKNGPLADGLIGGTTLVCPLHEMQFDLCTGKALSGECTIATFPVTEKDGNLMVELGGD